jgi:tagaturonate reductase
MEKYSFDMCLKKLSADYFTIQRRRMIMNNLSRDLINSDFAFNDDLLIGSKSPLTQKVLQFGGGNFLRAFVDYMIDELNSNNLFNGSVTVVQSIQPEFVDLINEQDGVYTVLLRGIEDGKEKIIKKIITSVSGAVNPDLDFHIYMDLIKNPDLRFIVSNTTEAGITYRPNDKLSDAPPISFPAKVTALLYERYKIFNGHKDKGFIFIPCELIDNNGTTLKNIVMQYAKDWNLESEFISWVNDCNYFTNTLVDRIVTGYPKDEIDELTLQLGYTDKLINTAEIFHFWVIEGPSELAKELPFDKIGLNVIWTDDATPYKMRKVRILNGAHTMSVLAAYLSGKNTVGEILEDEYFIKYLQKGLFEEVIPTLNLEYEDLKSFADSVFDRFSNPYIKHYLLSISLNSVSKYKTRVLPSILEYYSRKNELPKILTFSFAALIAFYKGKEIINNSLVGLRDGEEYNITDDLDVLQFFQSEWDNCDNSLEDIDILVKNVCQKTDYWGIDLSTVGEFSNIISNHLHNIVSNGVYSELKEIIK